MILIPGYTPDDFCQGDNYDAARVLQKAHAQEHGETLLYDHHGDIIPSPEAMAKAIRYANHKHSLSAPAGLKAFDRMRPGGDSDFSDPETLGTQAGEGMAIQGLKFQHCMAAFGVDRDTHPLASTAHEKSRWYGNIEIDPLTVLSESEDGAYVLGWAWVDRPSTEGTAE